MSNRGIHAIMMLVERPALDMEIANLMAQEKVSHDDDFTYTTRFTVPPERRAEIRAKIEARCPVDARKFLDLMDEYDWDVSFLVDGF